MSDVCSNASNLSVIFLKIINSVINKEEKGWVWLTYGMEYKLIGKKTVWAWKVSWPVLQILCDNLLQNRICIHGSLEQQNKYCKWKDYLGKNRIKKSNKDEAG